MSRLNMTFDEGEDKMIDALKKDTGLTQTTELMRYLIKKELKRLDLVCGDEIDKAPKKQDYHPHRDEK